MASQRVKGELQPKIIFLSTDQPFRKRKVGEIAELEANRNGRNELLEIAVTRDRRLAYHAGTHLRAHTWCERLKSRTRWPAKASFSCTQKRLWEQERDLTLGVCSTFLAYRDPPPLGSDEIFLSQPWAANVAVVATQEAPIPTLCRLSVSRTE